MDKNIRTLLVRNERIEVSEAVYKAYYKEREHEKYLDKKKRDNEYSYEGMKEKGIVFEYNEGLIEMSPEEKLLKDIEKERLREALSALNKDEMFLIDLYYFENKSEREIAEIFSLSQKAVNKRKKRILEKLKSIL
ncbi:sigma-70 family RNA polymerase sigma factor [Anaerofustis stercorihominis]|uniref:RNA polymerase sigma factor, sigma-70 family n=2 Tax=Anaerofustis stercorihominis TaxID=214853 RepID=B1C5U0_9FIRM|nr:sigma-70 family RNA polymerase sigma factor [Anaerofustis stercorihominis]EDS73509.1 RNA polymerase sigma factor, sigma-70 family [Anaerofustis stercorihominis DSM 17244]MCQ4794682.1 sigma-70 family RNA polymerase sigma factor [Anaerofustis stercorihominis]RGD73768.1 sigma-70 family RNA polymerase sigma factor [Anaerofustis stercorihominis]